MADADTDDSAETVTYQFTAPKDAWRQWTATVDDETPLYERLTTLIEQDADLRSYAPGVQATTEDTVCYQVAVPAPTWDQWADAVPRSTRLSDRLVALIDQDSQFRGHRPDVETVTFEFELSKDVWDGWLEAKPANATVHEHLRDLLTEEMRTADGEDWSDMEEGTARLLAKRIKHRSRTAKQALGNDNIEKVREELDEIREIAALFEE